MLPHSREHLAAPHHRESGAKPPHSPEGFLAGSLKVQALSVSRRMCSELPTDVPSLLDFLWGPEHGTGTDETCGRMVVA